MSSFCYYFSAAMYRNNNYTRADDWLLNIYFNKKIFTNLWVYGNHVFLLMLYLCYYTSLPEIQVFGSTMCIWKIIALMSAPWSITRLCIMVYLLLTSLSKIAHHDVLIRRNNRQETEKARQSK
ncbi:uncharacterized protein LOC132740791 [Ruditapes philippinarum]|uniref:uncharacterized protein LOC132740791 n=1 Tax=Ruditapes philippinarum TaxID=129788 RepID=UPI00295AD99A|nr:uncharacterized protein LOC132740791 [Ruditapes philippinarum]